MIDNGKYYATVVNLLNVIEETQKDILEVAGSVIFNSLENDGILHVFSTGHSHMLVEELFYRAGGLVQVNPILDPALMLHQGAVKSTKLERLPGYAENIIEGLDLREGEPIIIVSNSGINTVPVEMAILAKQKGLKVIAITSVGISSSLNPRHPSGKKLMDVADIVIDNCIKDSDAALEIKGTGQKVGAVSSISGIFIVQKLVLCVINGFIKKGKVPPVYMSANIPGGDIHNMELIQKYSKRIRGLY